MNNVSQKRLELQNAIRSNKSEIANCDASLDSIATGVKVSHPKAYYEKQKELLTKENDVLQAQLDSGDYLKEDSAGNVTVDLSPVVNEIQQLRNVVGELVKAFQPGGSTTGS